MTQIHEARQQRNNGSVSSWGFFSSTLRYTQFISNGICIWNLSLEKDQIENFCSSPAQGRWSLGRFPGLSSSNPRILSMENAGLLSLVTGAKVDAIMIELTNREQEAPGVLTKQLKTTTSKLIHKSICLSTQISLILNEAVA